MTKYTIYVPNYVDLKGIQTCPLDSRAEFVTVDPETFDLDAKRRKHSKFILFEKDHFLVYEKQNPEPFKCSYHSRNHVMYCMGYLGLTMFISHNLVKYEQEDGCLILRHPRLLVFIFRPDAECLDAKNRSCCGDIAEFYDTVEEEDFDKFAEIARTKESCVEGYFVVNRGQEYHIVDTQNPSLRYTCSPAIKDGVLSRLGQNIITIQGLFDEDKKLLERREKAKCAAGFKLCDNQGVPLSEGAEFELEIYNEDYHGRKDNIGGGNEDDEDDEYDEYDEDVSVDYLVAMELHKDVISICAIPLEGSKFGFTVVDGITYLTSQGCYFGFGEGDHAGSLVASPEIPPKDRRIQIQYAEDGNIVLSGWDGSGAIYCDWLKASCGIIMASTKEAHMRWSKPLKLVIKF
ncbi:hypothetical protein H4R99_000839 [Coemansia sp. RSA 1722]|nr:hypothetical protein H4R99_000839 [Coemansia sp. RSA 1722]